MQITTILTGAAAVAVAWTLLAPPQYTLPAQLGRLLGEFETQWTNARKEAVAAQAEEIASANARVERETYVAKIATDAEASVIQQQVQDTSATHWAARIGANLADIGCGFGILGSVQGNEASEKYLALCGMSDGARRNMALNYGEALNQGRTNVMEDMKRTFQRAQGTR